LDMLLRPGDRLIVVPLAGGGALQYGHRKAPAAEPLARPAEVRRRGRSPWRAGNERKQGTVLALLVGVGRSPTLRLVRLGGGHVEAELSLLYRLVVLAP